MGFRRIPLDLEFPCRPQECRTGAVGQVENLQHLDENAVWCDIGMRGGIFHTRVDLTAESDCQFPLLCIAGHSQR